MRIDTRKYDIVSWPHTQEMQNILSALDKFKLQWDTATIIGILLLALFFLQYVFNLSPPWLLSLQKLDAYKQITGFVLFVYVYCQWRLAFCHMNKQRPTQVQRNTHRVYGAIAPLLYYIHSVELGYAYQSLLSLAFLGNCLIGSINPQVLRIRSKQYYTIWVFTHIGLAVMVVTLLIYHLYVTYTY